MSFGSRLFKKYRKLIAVFIVLIFLGSTIPTAVAGRGGGKKKWCKPEPVFDLNATLDSVEETYKDYQALVVKIENMDEELDELYKLAKKGKFAALDLTPYYNKRSDLISELDELKDDLKDSWKTLRNLYCAKTDLKDDIKDTKLEIEAAEDKITKKEEELNETLKKLDEIDTSNPAKIVELEWKMEDILTQIDNLTEEYYNKIAANENTTEIEQKIEGLKLQYYLCGYEIQALLDEPGELEEKVYRLIYEILELESILEEFHAELEDLEGNLDKIKEAIDNLKEMEKGKWKLSIKLFKIKIQLWKLKKKLKWISWKRGGRKKDSPEPKIEVEMAPLSFPGMNDTYAVFKIYVTDELITSDPKEEAEYCMLQISTDGGTWYPVDLDLESDDGFNFVYVATEPGKYYFKASMGNWYGKLDYDVTSEDFFGNETPEQLDPDISTLQVSFNYWYNGYSINCVNQQQLIPQPNLANDVNSISDSLSNPVATPVTKTPYLRSLVSFQDGDDIVAIGYAETRKPDSTPLSFVQGDSFSVLESNIVSLGGIQEHLFFALPPNNDAPVVGINTGLGIIESPNLYRNDTRPGSIRSSFDSSVILLNVDDDEYLDWDYDIRFRMNISNFEDPTNLDNGSSDTTGINETKAEFEFNFTADDDSKSKSVDSFLKKLDKGVTKKFYNWWNSAEFDGNEVTGRVDGTIETYERKSKDLWYKFHDQLGIRFRGLKAKWLRMGKGLWGKFKGNYSELFKETNSTFKGLLSKLDFNITKKTGEDVSNSGESIFSKIKSVVEKVVKQAKEALNNPVIVKALNADFDGFTSNSKQKSESKKIINKSIKMNETYKKIDSEIKRVVERSIKGFNSITATGIGESNNKIVGNLKSIGHPVRDNETDDNNSRVNSNEAISSLNSIRALGTPNEANNKEIGYEIKETSLDLVDEEAVGVYLVIEVIGEEIDPHPVSPPYANLGDEDDLGENSRFYTFSYDLKEIPYDDLPNNDKEDMFYDSSSLEYSIEDKTYESPDWNSDEIYDQNSLAFVAFGRLGVRAVDLSDPENPDIRVEGSFENDVEDQLRFHQEQRVPNGTGDEIDVAIQELLKNDPANLTQAYLNNFGSELTFELDSSFEFFQELENETDSNGSSEEDMYQKGASWLKNEVGKGKSILKKWVEKGKGMLEKAKSWANKTFEKGKSWLKDKIGQAKGFIDKGKDWTKNKYEEGKSWSEGYIDKGKGNFDSGKSWVKGMYDKGKSWDNGYYDNAKGWINKSKSWVKDKIEQGKSGIINKTENINNSNNRTTNTRSDLTNARINGSVRIDDSDYITIGYSNSISKIKIKNELGDETHAFTNFLQDEEFYSDTDNTYSSFPTKTVSTTHLLEYNPLGQVDRETIFEHETGGVDYAWWGHCNGWVAASVIEKEPGDNNTVIQRQSSSKLITRLDPDSDVTLSAWGNESEIGLITGREVAYQQTLESSTFPVANPYGTGSETLTATKETTELYEDIVVEPGFYVPDLRVSSRDIDDPSPRDEILANSSDSENNSDKLFAVSMENTLLGYHLPGAKDVTGLQSKMYSWLNKSDDDVGFIYTPKTTHTFGSDDPGLSSGSVVHPGDTYSVSFDLHDLGQNSNQNDDNSSLNVNGGITGGVHEDYPVDFNGSIKVKQDFTKQFGENVNVTLKAGGSLSAKVERRTYEYGDLSGLSILADIDIGGSLLKLKGSIDGKVDEDYSVDVDGTIKVKKDFEYEGEKVKTRLHANGNLSLKVEKNKFKWANISNLRIDVDVDLGDKNLTLEGSVDGKINSNYKVDFTGELTVEEDFVYQASEKVKATLVKGGKVTAKVEQSEFKEATLDLTILADFTLKGEVLKLKEKIDGKINEDHSIDLECTINVREQFEYEKDKVTATIKKGARLGVNVEQNEFKKANISDLKIQVAVYTEQGALELRDEIDGTYESPSSYGDELCMDYGYSSRISSYGSWIEDFVDIPDDDDNNSDDNNSDDNNSDDNNLNTRANASKNNGNNKLSKTNTTFTYNSQASLSEKFNRKRSNETPNKHTTITHYIDYNSVGQVDTETIRNQETGNESTTCRFGYRQSVTTGVISMSHLAATGTAFDISQSYWTYWHWFDQLTSGWEWDGEISTEGNQWKNESRNYESGKSKLGFNLGTSTGIGVGGGINTNVDNIDDPDREHSSYNILAWHIESFDFPTLEAKNDSQLIQTVISNYNVTGYMDVTETSENDTFDLQLKQISNITSRINTTPGYYDPGNDTANPRMTKGELISHINSKVNISISKKAVVPENHSDMTKEDLINKFNISLKTGFLGPTSVNNCLLGYSGGSVLGGSSTGGSNFIIDSFFDITYKIDDDNNSEDKEETLIVESWFYDEDDAFSDRYWGSTTRIQMDIDDSGEVMGVEPSPFRFISSFNVFNSATGSEPGGHVRDNRSDQLSYMIGISDTFGGNSGSGVWQSLHIEKSFSMNISKIHNRSGDDWGVGQSPFHGGSNIKAVTQFNLNPSGEVMGVEPSPFRFASSVNILNGISQVGSSQLIPANLDRISQVMGVGQSPFYIDSFFDITYKIENGEMLIWILEKITFPALIGPEVNSFESLFEQLISVEDLSGNGTNIITTQNLNFNSAWTNINLSTYYQMSEPTDNMADSRNFYNDRLGNSSRDTTGANTNTDQNTRENRTGSSYSNTQFGLHWSSIINSDRWDRQNDPELYGIEVEVDISMIGKIGVSTERKNESDVDSDGKFDTGDSSSSWHHVYLSFSNRIQTSNVDGRVDGNNSSAGNYLGAHDGFSMESFLSTNIQLGNLLTSKFSEDNGSKDPTMTVAGFDLYHRLTRGTNSRTWGDGPDRNSPLALTVQNTIEISSLVVRNLDNGDDSNNTDSQSDDNSTRNSVNSLTNEQNIRGNVSSDDNETKIAKTNSVKMKVKSEIKVMFNPAKLKFDKTVPWNEQKDPGFDIPNLQFTSGRGLAFKSEIAVGLDKWTETDRKYTNYYNENSMCRISCNISIRDSGDAWGRSGNRGWGSISSLSWCNISSSVWGGISGSSGGQFFVDSFFDITYEIPPEYEYKIPDDKLIKINKSREKAKSLLDALNRGNPKNVSEYRAWYEELYKTWHNVSDYTQDGNFTAEDYRTILTIIVSGGFSLIKPIIDGVASAIIGGLGSIPFSGGAMSVEMTTVYQFASDDFGRNLTRTNGSGNSNRSGYTSYSAFEILNLRATLDGISNQMALLQTFSYSGMEMSKSNTTIAGDQYSTDTSHVENFGTITMTFKYEPKANASQDRPTMTVASFDIYHRLTRGTNSRTWGNGTREVTNMLSWNSSMVVKWSGDDDDQGDSNGQYWIDSFFDITYEIPQENENETVRSSIRQSIKLQATSYWNNNDVHPDFYWMAVKFKGYGESEDDLNDNDNPYKNYTRFRMVQRMNFSLLFGDDDSEIEMHADFMTKAELIGAVAVDINDSKNDRSQRSGNSSGDKPSRIIQTHTIQFSIDLKFARNNTSNDSRFSLWKVGGFVSNIVENYDSSNRSAHGNGSSNRVIVSAWRDFNNTRRFKIGINHYTEYFNDDYDGYPVVTNFKVEIEGVAAGHFTGVDNLSIEQEVIDYSNDREETSWCRVSSNMAGNQQGNWTLPDVDDEVLLAFSKVNGTDAVANYKDLIRNNSISIKIHNVTPGIEPVANRNLIVKFNSGNTSYRANITQTIKTGNNRLGNFTYIKIKIDVFEYYKDAAGNQLRRLFRTYTFEFNFSMRIVKTGPIYSEDFEGNISRLQNTNKNLWQAGMPSSGPPSVPSGEKCIGTGMAGNYSNNQTGRIILPAIDLSGLRNPELVFKHWYDIENGSDGGRVLVSTDGGRTFHTLKPVGGYPENVSVFGSRAYSGKSNGWEDARFDLSPYTNENLLIAFEFASDESKSRAGWYIDEVQIGAVSVGGTPGGGSDPPNDDSYEDNDVVLDAAPITQGNYDLQCKDDDWYEILLSPNQQAEVQIKFWHSEGDLDLSLYNSMGIKIAQSTGTSNNEIINIYSSTSNTFYFLVYGYNGAQASYTMIITITNIGPTDDSFEENDVMGDAAIVPIGTHSSLQCMDEDWYMVTLNNQGSVKIEFTHANGDLDLELYNNVGFIVAFSLSVTDNEEVVVYTPGTYYIRVFGWDGAFNNYLLTITETSTSPGGSDQSGIYYYEDFEGTSFQQLTIENFDTGSGQAVPVTSSGYGWEVGTPFSGPFGGTSGSNVIGTNLGGLYPDDLYGYFVLPTIDLSGAQNPRLSFNHYYDNEQNWDGGDILISKNGGQSWSIISPFGNYPGYIDVLGNDGYTGYNPSWQAATFDLSIYADEDILIAFEFGSDFSIGYDGWYIDDIVVFEN